MARQPKIKNSHRDFSPMSELWHRDMRHTHHHTGYTDLTHANRGSIRYNPNPFVDLPDGYKSGFDKEFMSKLKTFFSMSDQGCRRTGRTTAIARILLEEAIESGRSIKIIDHHIDKRGGGEPVCQVIRKIQEWVRWYEEEDVFISVSFDDMSRTNPTFEARLMHEPDRYNELRIKGHYVNSTGNPFDTTALKKQLKKVLEEQILLIEFDE